MAELTVEEAAARDRNLGGRREPESRIGPSRDPFRVFDDRQPKTMGWPRTRGAMTSRVHRATSASERPLRPDCVKAWPSCCAAVAWDGQAVDLKAAVANRPVGDGRLPPGLALPSGDLDPMVGRRKIEHGSDLAARRGRCSVESTPRAAAPVDTT